MMRQKILSCFLQEQNRWILWLPVCMGGGIGLYFSMTWEPPLCIGIVGFFSCFVLVLWQKKQHNHHGIFLFLILCSCWGFLGFLSAQIRTWSLQTPQLRTALPPQKLQGTVETLERKPHKTFVTLKVQEPFPLKKVRLSLPLGMGRLHTVLPGDHLEGQVVLWPPSGPPTPEMYNFRQKAYFMGLGAVGYFLEPPRVLKASKSSAWFQQFQKLRHKITVLFQEGVGGQPGAIAAALVTGDRSGLTPQTQEAFAHAGIAHILAISGLHLAIVAGLIFWVLRKGLCFFPPLALRVHSKKWAAMVTLLFMTAYLLLCWDSVSAQRAYLMTVFVMLAMLLDRRALSLYNVSWAATLILLFRPESMMAPSFQLSFSAVVILIAGYEGISQKKWIFTIQEKGLPQPIIYGLGVLSSTILAGLATTPYTVYIFHQMTLQGILANLVAIPLTTFWIMPLEVLSVLAMPWGLHPYPFQLLEPALCLLETLALKVSSWPYAAIYIAQGSSSSMICMTLGGLWISLWRQPWRWLGVCPLGLGLLLYAKTPKVDMYVDPALPLIALRDGQTLYVTHPRKKTQYILSLWQKHGGNPCIKPLNTHPHFQCIPGYCEGRIQGKAIEILWDTTGRKTPKCIANATIVDVCTQTPCKKSKKIFLKNQDFKGKGALLRQETLVTWDAYYGKRPWT